MLPLEVTSRKIHMNPAASSARLMAPRQVGGLFRRASRACSRSVFFFSWGLGGRPVRPLVVTVPAAFPRCLVRRLRLVWAIVLGSLRQGGERVFDSCVPAQRNLLRKTVERVLWRQPDELGAGRFGVARDRGHDGGQPGGAVVLDVGRDLSGV